jgi:phosphoglucosamine mutase
VDATGADVDGDQIMAILSLAMRERGVLAKDTLVATVMSNLGMLQALEREGVDVRQAAVGDRYVLEEMKAGQLSLGGEQSGHVIFLEHGTTGDGTMTGLMLASRLAGTGRSLHDLAAVMTRLPQVMINVKGVDKGRVDDDPAVQSAVREVEQELGDAGRVLLRKSGTEPLVRVMVEADEAGRAQQLAERLAGVVREHLALGNR